MSFQPSETQLVSGARQKLPWASVPRSGASDSPRASGTRLRPTN